MEFDNFHDQRLRHADADAVGYDSSNGNAFAIKSRFTDTTATADTERDTDPGCCSSR